MIFMRSISRRIGHVTIRARLSLRILRVFFHGALHMQSAPARYAGKKELMAIRARGVTCEFNRFQ